METEFLIALDTHIAILALFLCSDHYTVSSV